MPTSDPTWLFDDQARRPLEITVCDDAKTRLEINNTSLTAHPSQQHTLISPSCLLLSSKTTFWPILTRVIVVHGA
jgi:hypothetical protein